MDKFGIFNLLNSFFPLTSQKNQVEPNANPVSNDFLSSLLTSFTNNSSSNKPENDKQQKVVSSAPHPLQEQMLLTVSNHDAFVKRVKQNTKAF